MKIKNESSLSRLSKKILQRLEDKLENTNNGNFRLNGEECFLRAMLNHFSGQKMVVFDVGANVGDYSDMVLKVAQECQTSCFLHAFEPTGTCYSALVKSFSNDKRIIINHFGLSNASESREIYYDTHGSALASLYKRNLKAYNLSLNDKESIQLKRLDEYIRQNSIQKINFLKVDIEGHELSFFEGAGDYLNCSFIDGIQFEYGGANLDSHTSLMDINELLTGKGFDLYKIMPKCLRPVKYHPRMDNFLYCNYVALSPDFEW